MTTATEMNLAPSVSFRDNAAVVFGGPKQEEPALESNHPGLTGLFDRMAANTQGIRPDPAQEIRLTSAMVTGVDAKPVGNAELVERANAGGGVLQEPGPVRAESAATELGGQAMKMGGELFKSLGSIFGGDDQAKPEARLTPTMIAPAPAMLKLG